MYMYFWQDLAWVGGAAVDYKNYYSFPRFYVYVCILIYTVLEGGANPIFEGGKPIPRGPLPSTHK